MTSFITATSIRAFPLCHFLKRNVASSTKCRFGPYSHKVSTSQRPITPNMNLIEVESRVLFTAKAIEQLNKQAGTGTEARIHDTYFLPQLALQDKWLRLRNGVWELKAPVENLRQGAKNKSVVYREIVGEAVHKALHPMQLNVDKMDVYADLVTVRRTWNVGMEFPWAAYDIHVTADDVSSEDGFRCRIGEMEILVEEKEQVMRASKAIEQACDRLGFVLDDKCGGKLIKYLREKDRSLYEKLDSLGLT